MVHSLVVLVLVALATSAVSFTITTTSMFMWLRELVSPIHHKAEELIHCPWCLSHYVAIFFLMFCYKYLIFLSINVFIHLLIDWFAVICISGILHYVLLRTYKPIAEYMLQRQLQKLNNNE